MQCNEGSLAKSDILKFIAGVTPIRRVEKISKSDCITLCWNIVAGCSVLFDYFKRQIIPVNFIIAQKFFLQRLIIFHSFKQFQFYVL